MTLSDRDVETVLMRFDAALKQIHRSIDPVCRDELRRVLQQFLSVIPFKSKICEDCGAVRDGITHTLGNCLPC